MPAAREAALGLCNWMTAWRKRHLTCVRAHALRLELAAAEREYRRLSNLTRPMPRPTVVRILPVARAAEKMRCVCRACPRPRPLSLIISTDLAELLVFNGEYERAVRQCRKTLEMDPNFGSRIASSARLFRLGSTMRRSKRWSVPESSQVHMWPCGFGLHLCCAESNQRAVLCWKRRSSLNERQESIGTSRNLRIDRRRRSTFQWLDKALAARDVH